MRLMAISIVISSGAFGAGLGVIAESLPDARYRNELDTMGMVVAGIGLVLFVIEWKSSGTAIDDK